MSDTDVSFETLELSDPIVSNPSILKTQPSPEKLSSLARANEFDESLDADKILDGCEANVTMSQEALETEFLVSDSDSSLGDEDIIVESVDSYSDCESFNRIADYGIETSTPYKADERHSITSESYNNSNGEIDESCSKEIEDSCQLKEDMDESLSDEYEYMKGAEDAEVPEYNQNDEDGNENDFSSDTNMISENADVENMQDIEHDNKIFEFLISENENTEDECEEAPENKIRIKIKLDSHQNQESNINDPERMSKLRGMPTTSLLGLTKPKGYFDKYSFLHRVYLVVLNERYPFICWSPNGHELQLDYIALQEHLMSEDSVFECRSVLQFTGQLLDYGFERVWPQAEDEEETNPTAVLLYYYHSRFGPQKLFDFLTLPKDLHEKPRIEDRPSKRDPLIEENNKQLARGRLQTLIDFHKDVRLLNDQSYSSELLAQLVPRRGRVAAKTEVKQVSVWGAKYVKPQESVLTFSPGFSPEYAGFYGNVDIELVNKFFGESLPLYGHRITGYKEIITDSINKANGFQQNLPIGVNFSDEEDEHNLEIDTIMNDMDDMRDSTNRNGTKSPLIKKMTKSRSIDDNELEKVMQALCDGDDDTSKMKMQDLLIENDSLPPELENIKMEIDSVGSDSYDSSNKNAEESVLVAAAAATAANENELDSNVSGKSVDSKILLLEQGEEHGNIFMDTDTTDWEDEHNRTDNSKQQISNNSVVDAEVEDVFEEV